MARAVLPRVPSSSGPFKKKKISRFDLDTFQSVEVVL
jgi:hypothetical protein